MRNLVSKIQKLSPEKGDMLVIHTEANFDEKVFEIVKEVLRELDPKHDIPCLLLHGWRKTKVEFEKPTDGRHKVYLNNLEYMEYLHNKEEIK